VDPINLNESVRIAVMGTGSIGMRHLMLLGQIPGVRAIAVPKRKERRNELANQGWDTASSIDEAASMGAKLGIIASASGQHLVDGLAGLKSGLDLLIEKPLATNSLDAQYLMKRAQETGLKIFVGCVLRFSESLNNYRDLLPQVGRLHSVRIECQSYLPNWHPDRCYQASYSARADEGGALRDLIHEIDYAGWLFGWPASLQSTVKNLGRLNISSDEAANLNWETLDGYVLSIRLDYLSKPMRRGIIACGEQGTIQWDGVTQTVNLSLDGQHTGEYQSEQTTDAMYLAQIHAILDAIRGDVDPRIANGDDGVKALAVCDTARLASESRSEEPVTYP